MVSREVPLSMQSCRLWEYGLGQMCCSLAISISLFGVFVLVSSSSSGSSSFSVVLILASSSLVNIECCMLPCVEKRDASSSELIVLVIEESSGSLATSEYEVRVLLWLLGYCGMAGLRVFLLLYGV